MGYELLEKQVDTYILEETRKRQEDHMLLEFLKKSITEKAYQTVTADRAKYIRKGHESGILFLKTILEHSRVDSSIDPDIIRTELSHASAKFKALNYNVIELNTWVLQKMDQLTQKGETSTDTRSNLFNAYESSNDEEFRQHVSRLRDEVSDNPTKKYDYKWLMNRAKDKYDRIQTHIKMRSITGENEPREDPIVALTARVEELQRQHQQRPNNRNREGSRGNNNNRRWRSRTWRNVPQALQNKPAPSDITIPEVVDGSKWWYCTVHGWCPHPFEDQEGIRGCFYNRNNKKDGQQGRSTDNSSDNSSNDRDNNSSNNNDDGRRNGRAVRALAALPGRG